MWNIIFIVKSNVVILGVQPEDLRMIKLLLLKMEQQCFKNVLLFKLTFTGTHIDHNYFSCTIREKDQLHIFFVLFVYLESMLTIYN